MAEDNIKDAFMKHNIRLEVMDDIWNICKKSPEHGNAVMDIIGEVAYKEVSEISRFVRLYATKEEYEKAINYFIEKGGI
jgi:hypothetical protein